MKKLSDILENLDIDTFDWVIELATEIIQRNNLIIECLTRGEQKLVCAIYAARGRLIKRIELQEICTLNLNEMRSYNNVSVVLCNIKRKRPDIYSLFEIVHNEGIRWENPKTPIPLKINKLEDLCLQKKY